METKISWRDVVLVDDMCAAAFLEPGPFGAPMFAATGRDAPEAMREWRRDNGDPFACGEFFGPFASLEDARNCIASLPEDPEEFDAALRAGTLSLDRVDFTGL